MAGRKARSAQVDLAKLCSSIRASRMVLEPYRVARREAVRKYAGDQWSTETAYVKRPINFLSLYLTIMSRSLIAHDPRVSLKVMKKEFKATVSAMEEWVNPEIVRMNLADSLHRGVVDAIHGFHAMKVALCTPAEAEKSGWGLKAGQPYASTIDLDDWCMDPHARTIHEAAWMGHRTRVRVDSIADSKLYDAVRRKMVHQQPDPQYNDAGDERISMLGRQYISNDLDEAYEYCDLWEIYLPMEKMIVTMQSEDGGTPHLTDVRGEEEAFAEREWVGPYCGPYHFLNLMPPVSGNAMPKGPIQDLIDMDDALNGLTQKLIEQAARQKEILAVGGSADGDAQRIVEARDGEVVRMDFPDKMKPMGFGGPHPNNQNFALSLWEMLNKIGGNIELMGGLGEQSKTAAQDKMLNANAGATVKFMQQAVVKHTSAVIESLCWFWHHHPEKVMTSYHPIQGLANPIERKITPRDRMKVPFEAMRVQVDPYSLNHSTPAENLAFLNQVVGQIITPLLPMMQQQGLGLNLPKYLELVAKYGNAPDLNEIITNLPAPEPTEEGGGEDGPMKPGTTSRTYNRINASEQTGQGQVKANLQSLMGQPKGGRPSNSGSYQPVGGR